MSGPRLLTDRHHADLLYSLQRLFSDRLGTEVYVPVGMEWWEEGYWRFGEVFGDDRLAQQYLNPEVGWRDTGAGIWITYDRSHPERVIVGVTREGFHNLGEWDFVMPTVQENQSGFKRLADEVGARYLYHVGNTGQWIDWSLDPFVISTSEATYPKGKGVTIHQEMDDSFAWRWLDNGDRRTVRSFVNHLDRTPGYEDFLAAEEVQRGWEFEWYGHQSRGGFITPVSAVADLMSRSGWGWHYKPGDGFGHVIHAWAASGRPLIGPASGYRGKMAEVLWEDGVTCLDTEKRSLAETIRLMREIATDHQRHDEMCQAIRARFDAAVDYEAEADAVLSALF